VAGVPKTKRRRRNLPPRPRCLKHPDSHVWRDGWYGADGHRRQRYRCLPGNGDKPHVFTEELPRKRPPDGECYECERNYAPHEGPQTARFYAFTTREIALALVAVGRGQSYRAAARFVRERAQRLKLSKWGYPYATAHPNLVLDWVEVFAETIFERYRPKRWPDVLVLDHIPFHVAQLAPSGYPKQSGKLAFCVFGAVGYRAGRPRIWKLAAYPTPSRDNWVDFLSSLPGRPRHIVCDEATGLLKAIPRVWPETQDEPAPLVFLCTYHLWKQAYERLRKARLHGKNRRLRQALDVAFANPWNWLAFCVLARRYCRFVPALRPIERWLHEKEPIVGRQIMMRYYPTSIGALEDHLREVKNALSDRRAAFRNRERMNRLLMLLQLHANGQDDERRYARIIRETLEANSGHAFPRHRILDRGRISSLRA
jgi:hypothetical protein